MPYEFFKPTQEVNKCIDDKEIDALRAILVGIINRDPTFATKRFEEALDYICDNLNVWEDISEKLPGEYELEQDDWNKEYFRKQLAWLSQNFTYERVEMIKKIGKYVYASENTWGKDEAENFYHPVTQEKKNKNAGVRSEKILKALLVVVIIIEMEVLKNDINLFVKIIGTIISGIVIVYIGVGLMKKK